MDGTMTYIIAEPCIDIKDKSCVDVCPVDCIHEFGRASDERRLDDHLIEPGRMSGAEARRVGVVRIPENRNVRPALSNIYRVDTRYVADDQVGRSGRVLGDELMRGQEPLQLTAEEEIDPHEQDRRHRSKLAGKKDSAPRRATSS